MGMIFDIQRFSTHDGPGIRTTVFLKGCPLRCAWCHNPESQSALPVIGFSAQLCVACGACAEACAHGCHVLSDNKHTYDRTQCRLCGECVRACSSSALELAGREATVAEVMQTVLADLPFYRSYGGLTLSGGEPAAQPEFAAELLTAARKHCIHTAVETCGYVPYENLAELLPFADLFLYDIKDLDPERHKRYTGVDNRVILENLKRLLRDGATVLIRSPRIPGYNDRAEHWERLAEFVSALPGSVQLEVLPYNDFRKAKHRKIGFNEVAGAESLL